MIVLRFVSLVLLLPSLALLTVSFWPPARQLEHQPLNSEVRAVDIEYPASLRPGGPAEIRLSLLAAEGEADDAYSLMASAQLDSVDLQTDRPGDWEQPLLPGKSATWRWTVTAETPGRRQADIIIHLRRIPKNGGAIEEKSIWARTLTFQAGSVFGLPPLIAESLGISGVLLSMLLNVPAAEKIYARLWGKISRQHASVTGG